MNTQVSSPVSLKPYSLKRLIGGILLIIGLLNSLIIIVPLVFLHSTSCVMIAFRLYVQCLPLLLICIGVHLLTDLAELRIPSLLSVGLSPFLTWEHLGHGGWYWSINSILCIFFSLYTLQHLFRLNAFLNQQMSREINAPTMPHWLPSTKKQATIAAIGYWLFFMSVFAPFIVRLIDFISLFFQEYEFIPHSSDVWDMSDYNFNIIHNCSLALALCLAAMLYIIWTCSEFFAFQKLMSTQKSMTKDSPDNPPNALSDTPTQPSAPAILPTNAPSELPEGPSEKGEIQQ